MASRSLGTLTVDLLAKTGLLEQGLDKGGRAAQKFARDIDKQASKVQASFDKAFKTVGIAAGAAFAAVSVAVKSSIDDMYQLVTYSKQVAMPVDQFTAYAAAANNAEVQTEDFMTAMRTLLRNLQNAQMGSTRMQQLFGALNIDPAKIKTGQQAFMAMADAFGRYKDDANKAAIATQLMSRSGAALIPFLDQGSAAIEAQAKHMRDLGVAFGEDGASKLSALDDAMDEWHNTLKGISNTLALALVPALTDVKKKVTDFVQAWNNNGGLQKFIDGLETLISHLGEIAVFFGTRFVAARLVAGIAAIGSAATAAGTAVGLLRVALTALGGPIGLVATAIAGSITALIEYNKRFDDVRVAIDQSNDSLRTFLGLSGAAQFKQSGVLAASVQRDTETLKALSAQIEETTKKRNAAFKEAAGSTWSAAGEASRGQLAALDGQLAKLKAQQKELTATRDKNQATLDQYRKDLADPHSALHAGQTGGGLNKPSINIPTVNPGAKSNVDALASAYDALAKASNQYANSLTADDALQKANEAMAAGVENLAKLREAYIKAGGSAKLADELFTKGLAGLKDQFTFDIGQPKRELDAYTGSLRDQLDALKASNDAKLKGMTLGAQAAQDAQQLADATQSAAKAVADFVQAHQLHPEAMSEDMYQSELAALKQHNADMLAEMKRSQDAMATLRQNFDAGWQKGIADFIEQTQDKFQQGQQLAQQFTSGFSDAFEKFASGAESAKKAFGDFIDDLFAQALRFVANQAIAKLFNAFGNNGQTGSAGGSGGGWGGLINAFASYFGGGRAGGGPVAAGGLYEVNERGAPEMLAIGGRQFLMMGPQAGIVQPASRSHGFGGTTINVAVQPTSTRRTADQVATAVARQQRIATARNG